MIKSLRIQDYTIIDFLEIEFENGLNVITGETGAGKSIIIDAIDIALGSKAGSDLIKFGKTKAIIEVEVDLSEEEKKEFLKKFEIDEDCENIIFSREITQNGTKTRVCGSIVSQAVLLEMRKQILDVHSQHQTYTYLQPKTHIDLLDNFGDNSHLIDITDYKLMYKNYCDDKNKLENLRNNFQNNEKQRDFLAFQIEEIKNAEISDVNEFEILTAKADILNNAAELKDAAYSSYTILYGDEINVIDGLMTVESNLKKVSQYDKNLEEIQNSISDIISNLREISRNLRNYEENCEVNEELINEVQSRLELLSKIKRKYGNSLQEVLDNYNKFLDEYSVLENSDEYIKELEHSIEKQKTSLTELARKISSNRKLLAQKIASEVTQELRTLEMPYAKFDVKTEEKELSSNGIDDIEFMIITNPTEPFKPLSKIASGGEISRVMLAIKSILAEADKISCVIFDEIDTGISGKTSQAIANKLQKLSVTHQILLITHQPIIAAIANTHFHVIKEQSENEFSTRVKKLDREERAKVLSKMLSGDDSNNSLTLAYELLNR